MLPPLSIFSLTISILFLSLAPPPTACLHLYAGVQQTYLVSQSPSLKNIYKCKDRCFELNETFPFPMKVCSQDVIQYVRTVWARSGTNHMYLEGHCYLNLSLSETNPWTLFSSLNQTNIVSSPEQLATWQTYTQDCENKLVQMNPQLRITLGLTKVHSEYIFYSDGKFENTQEDKQGDIGEILRGLLGGL